MTAKKNLPAAQQGGDISKPRLKYPAKAADFGLDETKWRLIIDHFPAAEDPKTVVKVWALASSLKLERELLSSGIFHIVPFNDWKKKVKYDQIIPGIRLARIMAERSGEYAGGDAPVHSEETITRHGVELPVETSCTVYRLVGGQRMPFTASVRAAEFVGTAKKDGREFVRGQWKTHPYHMMAVRAESAALRRAWPSLLDIEAGAPVNIEAAPGDDGVVVSTMRRYDEPPIDNPADDHDDTEQKAIAEKPEPSPARSEKPEPVRAEPVRSEKAVDIARGEIPFGSGF